MWVWNDEECEMVKISFYCFLQHLSEDKTVQDVLQRLFHRTKDLRSLHLLLVGIHETPPCFAVINKQLCLIVLFRPFSWALPQTSCMKLLPVLAPCRLWQWLRVSQFLQQFPVGMFKFYFTFSRPFYLSNKTLGVKPFETLFSFLRFETFFFLSEILFCFLVNPEICSYWNLYFLLELPPVTTQELQLSWRGF